MTASLADLQISSASTQYVRVPVYEQNGSDPTGNTVSMAFPASGAEPVTFYTGSWTTISSIHYAQCLVGSAGVVTLTNGFYDVYVKITETSEAPVLYSGVLEVF